MVHNSFNIFLEPCVMWQYTIHTVVYLIKKLIIGIQDPLWEKIQWDLDMKQRLSRCFRVALFLWGHYCVPQPFNRLGCVKWCGLLSMQPYVNYLLVSSIYIKLKAFVMKF